MHALRVAVAVVAIGLMSSASAATLMLEWDAANWVAASPGDTFITNPGLPWQEEHTGVTGYIPGTGGEHSGVDSGPLVFLSGTRFVDNGDDRPYVDFHDQGWSGGPQNSHAIFNATGTGYTEVTYLYMPHGMTIGTNTGFGTFHVTDFQTALLRTWGGGGWMMFYSNTAMKDADGNNLPLYVDGDEEGINGLIHGMYGQWYELVKVHDLAAGEIRYYINGELAISTDWDPGEGSTYANTGDWIGWFGGEPIRWIQGLGVSYFAAYDGPMSDAEVQNLHKTYMGIPEPATMTLLALGGLALLRRKK